MPDTDPIETSPHPQQAVLVRVQVPETDLSYETIKAAIYAQARYLHGKGTPLRLLLLSTDIYEILNRRLVFKTAAHKELPHFITPFGNMRVQKMDETLDEPRSFIIEG